MEYDSILQSVEIACILCERLKQSYPNELCARYRLQESDLELDSYDLFCTIGKKRGFLISGGEINTERTANMLLDEFRAAKIGRITLDGIFIKNKNEESEDAGV